MRSPSPATAHAGSPPPSPARSASETGPDAVRAVGLRKTYGTGPTAVHALDGVDVAFARGSFHAIMGPSGSGKSTLMHCLAGLDGATAGTVWLSGADRADVELTALPDEQLTRLRRDRIGFVFQAYNLLPALSAQDNVLLPMRLAGRRPEAAWLADVVGRLGLADRMSHRPYELSGGQQQRVAIARALLPRPDVVFADEPTGNLDSRAGAEVLALLRSAVRETGQTVVMVTHDPGAAAYADRVLLMADGRLAGHVVEPTVTSVIAALHGLGA